MSKKNGRFCGNCGLYLMADSESGRCDYNNSRHYASATTTGCSQWIPVSSLQVVRTNRDFYELTDGICCHKATVVFEGGKFVRCDYTTLNNPYSFDDWGFLKKVAEFVYYKQKELEKQ